MLDLIMESFIVSSKPFLSRLLRLISVSPQVYFALYAGEILGILPVPHVFTASSWDNPLRGLLLSLFLAQTECLLTFPHVRSFSARESP